jgi:glycerol-3-phosphate dehydrogenase
VQGSHIVVRRLFDHERCYIFQNADGRIVFAIPFERDFTLVGTTDRDYAGDPGAPAASGEEISYLCAAVSSYFNRRILPADIVWNYSGVRPLYDDGSSAAQTVTRDYVLALDAPEGQPALLSVFGGKITTYRRLAEAAMARLAPHLPGRAANASWTGGEALPGGDFPVNGFDTLAAALGAEHPYLPPEHVRRLARAYGTRAGRLLEGCRKAADLGRRFGADLSEREVAYLMDHEWAAAAADVVWRRSKLGLRLTRDEIASLDSWMGARRQAAAEPPRAAGASR